ncbi:terminase small subunit [Salmonella enterica subsp. enterica serovar Newport]|uniref:Terminase small subunit n=1 Tax=Salmonella newport TaxID=108619 RepID=A0A5Y0S0F9_SALNE|nr:terminase small subunit [Salmonella enterica subsp. enterica serovar Newport]EBS4408648.1 terminase small subunit [Salmonella enterica subsp. enterica serovar Newport]ECB7109589.1 terminase small subunit [Salmonella enterica subsp. enterica serovar Newport]ECF2112321.1 terminase small subunit [Salmonella enterica subsp. enterica serovar Newport]ECJ3621518.1 terminase small subunit [Salmonella enterica subsp. enterica serovar Newport]
MKLNKKEIASIFGVNQRTIERWQSQGMPQVSGGGKGVAVAFDSAKVVEWYAGRSAAIENAKLRKEVDDLRADAESDLVPGTVDYERYRLTRAQADAQELKNTERQGEVLEIDLFAYILQRIAQEIVVILSRVPLTLQRKYPEMPAGVIDVVATEITKATDKAATIADLEKWLSHFDREIEAGKKS